MHVKNILIPYRASCFTVKSIDSLNLRRKSREGTICFPVETATEKKFF